MSNFKNVRSQIYNQAIDETSSTEKVPLGTRVKAIDRASTDYGVAEFIYLKGVASTVVGSFVTYSQDDHSTVLLAANAIGPVATGEGVASAYNEMTSFIARMSGSCKSIASNSRYTSLMPTVGVIELPF